MRLRSPRFEKALRRRVREELRTHPELAREERRQRRRLRDRNLPSWAGWAFGTIWFFSTAAAALAQLNGVPLALSILAFGALAGVALQASLLRTALHTADELVLLYHLPLSDQQILSIQWRRHLLRTSAAVVFCVPIGIGLGWKAGPSVGLVCAAVGLVVLQFCLAEAVAVILQARWPAGPQRHLGWFFFVAMLLLFGSGKLGDQLPVIINAAWWIPPFGWINYVFYHGLVLGERFAWVLLAPVAAIFCLLPHAWRWLRSEYVVREPSPPLEELAADGLEDAPAARLQPGPTEIEDSIRAGEFLRPLGWERSGWIERLAGACLTPRQRLTAEFLVAANPGWTAGLKTAALAVVIGAGLIAALGSWGSWVLFVAGGLALVCAVPVAGGGWRGLRSCPTGGVFGPAYSVYPLAYGEMAWVILKVNALRILAACPLLAFLGAVAGWRLQGTMTVGLWIAVKAAALGLATQPLIVAARFGGGTNDTKRFKMRWLLLLVPLLITGLVALLAAAVALFLLEDLVHAAACLGVIALLSATALWLHSAGWNRSWFDLLRRQADGFGS
jgi:hypothetical protein